MQDIHAQTRMLINGFCRVCPVCDGRACAGEVPGMGGLGSTAAADKVSPEILRH